MRVLGIDNSVVLKQPARPHNTKQAQVTPRAARVAKRASREEGREEEEEKEKEPTSAFPSIAHPAAAAPSSSPRRFERRKRGRDWGDFLVGDKASAPSKEELKEEREVKRARQMK